MNIGELAERTGVTRSTIRFYERAGLMTAVERRPNGYRTYSSDAVVTLGLIAAAQKAGFSLEEIRSLLPADLATWEHDALVGALRRKVADIEALQDRLAAGRRQLLAVLSAIETEPGDINCAANARRVLAQVLGAAGAPPDVGDGASPAAARRRR